MLKRFLVISSFFLILLAYSGTEAYGQLITDSDKRLKTQKTKQKGGGFSLFKKKKGRSSSAGPLQQGGRGGSPRYSSGSPFASFNKRKSQSRQPSASENRGIFKKQRYTTPRYSNSGLAGIMSGKRKPVRYGASRPPFTKKDKNVTPRYSGGSPFKQSFFAKIFNPTASPRYSAGSPFTRKQKSVTPRYSARSPFEKNFFQLVFSSKSGPRYSAAMPFSKKQKTVTPRYSAGSPYSKSFLEKLFNPTPAVKYSAGSPFTKKQQTVTPRYSAGSPFTKKQMLITPRYSQGSPYQRGTLEQLFNPKGVTPRYSGGMPFTKKDKSVTPRYSAGSPFANVNWRWIKPRYSTNKHKFDGDPRVQYQMRPFNEGAAKYKGEGKDKNKFGALVANLWTTSKQAKYDGDVVPMYAPMGDYKSSTFSGNFKRKWMNEKDMHPSFHHNKVNNDSEMIRKGFRKWNVFWTRMNRNKVQPDAVTDKISKPKFDRKEAEIWN